MSKKKRISDDDLAAFKEAVAGTKPLKSEQRRARPAVKTIPKPVRRRTTDEVPLELDEAVDIPPVQGEEFISYKRDGVTNKILRKLRKGQYTIDALLDLHGLTVEEAFLAVNDFLGRCLQDDCRVVLIVHGKGHHSQGPVLKNKLNLWLRTTEKVLAFCSATAIHGSRGAVYILLKKATTEEDSDWTKKLQL